MENNYYMEDRLNKHLIISKKTGKWAILSTKIKEDFINLLNGKDIDDGSLEIIDKIGILDTNRDMSFNNNLSLIVLHTSNKCNYKCTYCYTNASSLDNREMNFNIGKKAVDKTNDLENKVIIEFHGGEPLIKFNIIKKIMKYATNLNKSKYRFNLQSNLSLLNQNIVDFLKKYPISIGTSLDGTEQINDKTRGKGSFNKTIRGIKLLKENGLNFSVILVANDDMDVRDVYNLMIEEQISKLKINPHFQQGRAEKLDINKQKLANKMLDLVDLITDYNLTNNNRYRLLNISYILNNIITNERNYMCLRAPCGASYNMLSINTDGSIYPCEEMIGKENFMLGNVEEERSFEELIGNSDIANKFKSRTIDKIEDCIDCGFNQYCGGGCPNKSLNGNSFYNKSELCGYYKILIPGLIWKLYENPKKILTLLQ